MHAASGGKFKNGLLFFKNIDSDDEEKKPEPKKVESIIAYFVNDEPSTKEEVEAIDSAKIESVNVIKNSIQLKELNTQNNTFYTGIIEVKLKDE